MQPRLIIIAGPNGSGKTSVTNRILEHHWIEGCTYINPDNIANDEFGDWNSPEAVMKAAVKATEMRYQLLEEGKSILFETVLSAQEKIDYVIKAKQKGYFVRLFFIGTNHPMINAWRIALRVMNGGHEVPIGKIISRYEKSIQNCGSLSKIVDRLYIYDNSIEDENAKLLFRAKKGILFKQYHEVNEWAAPLFEEVLEGN
jgi:predicted ABC-type ATPase